MEEIFFLCVREKEAYLSSENAHKRERERDKERDKERV